MDKMDLIKLLLCEETKGCAETTTPKTRGNHPYKIGANYHVRTVTYATAGKLKAIYEKEMVFEKASWVADTGRFNEYIKDTSNVKENEYIGEIIINRDAIVDVIEVDSVYEKVK